MTKMCTNFKTETDVAQNLIEDFFSSFHCQRPFHKKDFKGKNIGGMGLLSEEMEVLCAELNKRAEAATSSYSAAGDFLQYIYFVVVDKNYHKIQSKCLAHEFFFTDIF